MTIYQQMLVFYGVMALISGVIVFFLARDRLSMRLLSAFLVGITWPMSFPVALLFSLF
ncbi:GhoT/OrtT family toxin [Erwinia sp. HR93]|uniref:GhoT/OrtT family toxin n=1 Tax=Erwinia sp. HR93 TaxID=3094840 RepID=UPI002ADECC50|nr:GhoT/OrtT family toxin [Erwinia sp. HR93]MEA1065312.1 GhoT/OrtT family toxin [Erwinia sp. HR93]